MSVINGMQISWVEHTIIVSTSSVLWLIRIACNIVFICNKRRVTVTSLVMISVKQLRQGDYDVGCQTFRKASTAEKVVKENSICAAVQQLPL